MAKQNSSKVSATVQRLRVSLLFKLSTTWLREAIKKTYETLDIVHSSDDTPEPYKGDCCDVITIPFVGLGGGIGAMDNVQSFVVFF